ncbi:MAG: NADH-quinone oxidoreductase subunit L [Chthonomonadales bacterium]|nr:NADH-quinone oxidoreductase subunit L [Chthonomonadales bacterium]
MPELPSSNLVWLIPGLPLLGFLACAFVGKRIGRPASGALATLLVFASLAVSLLVLRDMLALPPEERRAFAGLLPGGSVVPWITIGSFRVDYTALIDPLSLLMCLVVTSVGGLIHLYSMGYMAKDRDYARFFTYMNLFIFSMLTLVLADSILLMFVGWEGVGLCSYLLIAFWYEDVDNSKAGNKAFIVNRIGDVGFALGMMAVFATFGTLVFYTPDGRGFLDMAARGQTLSGMLTAGAATLIGLLLFVGALGKSAQFPLHVWLPDAMAGPTPVSALIHAATMVTAGVVMVTRVSPLIVHSETAMTVIACVGLFTALFAATIALTQNDIKKVLAYSTVSQLGYMFLGCGVGAFTAGMFHVTTHAFFKALLFLGAGSAIHALGGEQDMRRMGGLAGRIPATFWTMAVATVAIAGIPPFAGFWSKDEILGAASGFRGQLGLVLYAIGLATAVLTAFYMGRLMLKSFLTVPRFSEGGATQGAHGADGGALPRDAHADQHGAPAPAHTAGSEHAHGGIHEAPPSMLVPLLVLAVLSAVGGLIGIPSNNLFEHFLEPATAGAAGHHAVGFGLGAVLGTAAGSIGLALAWALYARHRETGALLTEEQRRTNPFYLGSLRLWYVDAFLTWLALTVGGTVARVMWQVFDRFVIDGTVNAVGAITGLLSEVFRRLQAGYVRVYAMTMLVGVVAVVVAILWGAFKP